MKKQLKLCGLIFGLAFASGASAQDLTSASRDGQDAAIQSQDGAALQALDSAAAQSQADAVQPRDWGDVAWCVGGPIGPSFAYSDYNVANQCAARVGSFSRACSQAVRLGRCRVYNYYSIDSLNPGYCQCGGGGGGYVGTWY